MPQLRKFFALPARNQLFLVKVTCLVALIRVGLWLLPFQSLRQLLSHFSSPVNDAPAASAAGVRRVVEAVKITSRFIPQATCLTRALSVQVLLLRRGYPADLKIGVAKNEDAEFVAHAWIESQGQIVIGGTESITYYTAFSSLESKQL